MGIRSLVYRREYKKLRKWGNEPRVAHNVASGRSRDLFGRGRRRAIAAHRKSRGF